MAVKIKYLLPGLGGGMRARPAVGLFQVSPDGEGVPVIAARHAAEDAPAAGRAWDHALRAQLGADARGDGATAVDVGDGRFKPSGRKDGHNQKTSEDSRDQKT